MIKTLVIRQIIKSGKIVFFLLIAFVSSIKSHGQTRQLLTNEPSITIVDYNVIPDKQYDLKTILTDTSLIFKPDSLRRSESEYYWIRLSFSNPYPNKERYVFRFSGPFNYILYSFENTKKKWIGKQTGLNVPDGERNSSIVPITFQAKTSKTVYIRIELKGIQNLTAAIKPVIILRKEYTFLADEQYLYLSYLFCCIALLSFSGYNLYLYFELKDKTYLFYVVAQFGAWVYLTGCLFIFNTILPIRLYSITFKSDGSFKFYDINYYFMHVGTAIIFGAFMQFTRLYLSTKERLPKYDTMLKVLGYTYLVLETIFPSITLITGYLINTVHLANLLILAILSATMLTGVVAHKQGIKVARPFLMANLLPMIFIAGTSVSVLGNTVNMLFPMMAILSQIITFAIASVTRVKLINEELKAKGVESIRLESEIAKIDYQRTLVEKENENVALTIALEKERNELLQLQLEANQRELIGNSVYIHQKNKLLADLKTHVKFINDEDINADTEVFKNIRSSLNGDKYLDEEWDKFKLHFEKVHPSFFKDLQVSHPTLTRYELRLYAYFHINLSTKEIATLLNIAPASVRQAKMRLHKKMAVK